MAEITAPIGYNDQGQPIEEVITTATRLRSQIPWGALLAGLALGLLAHQLSEREPPPRRRRQRVRSITKRAR